MNITLVSDADEFAALRGAWDALLERARNASVFLSWEWQYTWWRFYGADHALRLLVASRDGETVGILPVYVQKSRVARVPVRILRFVGTGGDTSPDDLDALVDPTVAKSVAEAFSAALVDAQREWDVLLLTDMPEDSDFRRALAGRADSRTARLFCSARIAYAPLPKSWDEYLQTLHRDRRYTLRQTRRRIEAQAGARFFVCADGRELEIATDRLIALHHKRWHDRADQYGFSSPAYVGFHREVMRQCLERGWLRLYCLEVGSEIIAIYYCYRFRNRVFYFQGGFDPEMAKLRPGLVLMGMAFEHAISEGNSVFDMLRGEYDYKTQWARERRDTYGIQLYRPGIGSLVYRLRRDWIPALRQRFRRAAGSSGGEAAGA